MIHFTIKIETYTIPLRPDRSQFLLPPCAANDVIVQSVAAGIVRWIERQDQPGPWRRQLIETYPWDHTGAQALSAWSETSVALKDRMEAARWLHGTVCHRSLWEYALQRAAVYYIRGHQWGERQ